MDYSHSQRVGRIEAEVNAIFKAFEAKAVALTAEAHPHSGSRPEDRLLRVMKHNPSNDLTHIARSFILSIKSKLSEIDQIEADSARWHAVADYLAVKSDHLPADLPPSIEQAVLAVRKADSALASSVAAQCRQAAQAAQSEVNRLAEHYRKRTSIAARLVAYKRQAEYHRARGDAGKVATYDLLRSKAQASFDRLLSELNKAARRRAKGAY